MHSYEEVEKAIWPELLMGLSFSMPVPVLGSDGLLDVVFLYSVNRRSRSVNKPHSIIQANLSDGSSTRVNEPQVFEAVEFVPAPFEMPSSFAEKTEEAKALYAETREEVARGEAGPASKRYAELVWSVTQKPLRPYYRALSPTLFADCQ